MGRTLASQDPILDQGQGRTVPALLARKGRGVQAAAARGEPPDPPLGHAALPAFAPWMRETQQVPALWELVGSILSGGDPQLWSSLPALPGPGTLLPREPPRPASSSSAPLPKSEPGPGFSSGGAFPCCCAALPHLLPLWPIPGIQAPHAGHRPCFCRGVALPPGMAECQGQLPCGDICPGVWPLSWAQPQLQPVQLGQAALPRGEGMPLS